MEATELKIKYLHELKGIIGVGVFNSLGLVGFLERIETVCDSIERDLGVNEVIAPPPS